MNKNIFKVSVIIPACNAERYLSVCLESLLIQTLTDFEVIVVDDCSGDASPAIAESYLERFGGRMKIVTTETNSGSGGYVPRNIGLEQTRGKYVYFVDNDDLLIDVALETLYACAETYRANVVEMEKFFTCGAEPVPKNLELAAWCYTDSFVEEPTFETEDLAERVKKFLASKLCWAPWAKFIRRDFLLDNAITLPPMTIADDVVWTFKILCLAKRWLRVPIPLYVNRTNAASIMRRERTPEQMITFRTSPLITGFEALDEFMRGLDFFQKNPVVRLQVLNFFALMQIENMRDALNALDPTEAYEIFLREFKAAGTSQPALIAYLLTMNNLYRNERL